MRRLPRAVAVLFSTPFLMPLLGPRSLAQETLWKREGLYDHYIPGVELARVGDLDGDGLADVLVGFHYAGNSDPGVVRALRGSDGQDLFEIDGAANENLGSALAGLDDVDGDQVPDFAVASAANGRQVLVLSGATRSLIYTVPGGSDLCALGDVDGDLVTDFAVSRLDSVTSEVSVRSGATGGLLYTLTRDSYTFGFSLARIDDVDQDGVSDLLVGDYEDPVDSQFSGAVHLYSGRDGTWIRTFLGDGSFEQCFGYSVAGIGDVDGDGVPDIVIGAPEFRYLSLDTDGSVFVHSGATGALLKEWSGFGSSVFFGDAVADAGDVTGDGISDVLIGAFGANHLFDDPNGGIYLYSGATLDPIVYRLGDEAYSQFGDSIAPVGDVDGDGAADFAVGAQSGGGHWSAVHLVHGNDLYLNSTVKFPKASAKLVLTTSAGDPGQPALLVVEEVDGTPCFVPIASAALNPQGDWHMLATVPAGLAGHSVGLRSWSLDANGHLVRSSVERLGFR